MEFNSKKFECVRYWPGSETPEEQHFSPASTVIGEKMNLRDLGVQMSSDCSFSLHIDTVVTSASKLVGWILRTFRSRSKLVMITYWTSLIQSRLDYCSQLWCPNDQKSIAKLETVARQYTSHIQGLEGLDYWQRLKDLHMFSQERRLERYLIIFVWKVAMGMVDGYNMDFIYSPRRGWSAVPKAIAQKAPACVRRAKEASLAVKGAALYNLCPRGLGDMASEHQDRFKVNEGRGHLSARGP